jgi:hypothetical protein
VNGTDPKRKCRHCEATLEAEAISKLFFANAAGFVHGLKFSYQHEGGYLVSAFRGHKLALGTPIYSGKFLTEF